MHVCVKNVWSVIHFHWAKGTLQEILFSLLEYSDWLFLCTFVCACVLFIFSLFFFFQIYLFIRQLSLYSGDLFLVN